MLAPAALVHAEVVQIEGRHVVKGAFALVALEDAEGISLDHAVPVQGGQNRAAGILEQLPQF